MLKENTAYQDGKRKYFLIILGKYNKVHIPLNILLHDLLVSLVISLLVLNYLSQIVPKRHKALSLVQIQIHRQ